MEMWELYLITMLPVLGMLTASLAGAIGTAGVLLSCMLFSESGAQNNNLEKFATAVSIAKRLVAAAAILALISVFIPSEKAMYMMIGGYAVTNVDNIDKLPANMVGAANKFLENYTEEQAK